MTDKVTAEGRVSRDTYIKNFSDRATKPHWQKEALKQAHEIRKFEIDLYWKRAAYFWTFIAAAFAGYVVVHNDTQNFTAAYTITCLGFMFSLAWYFVNRGSSAWQRNWEAHVDLLEDEVMGPLHKTVINRDNYEFRDFAGPYGFSPSRINQILSLIVSVIWLFLMGDIIVASLPLECPDTISGALLSLITFAGVIALFWKGRSRPSDEKFELNIAVRKFPKEPQITA
jgi:hypothetical protein